MHLVEILTSPHQAQSHQTTWSHLPVPNWMIGAFKRRFITYADGQTDTDMEVYWLQSLRFSIDLRLPRFDHQLRSDDLDNTNPAQQSLLAQHQGWFAESHWNETNQQLSWQAATSLQLHDLWPEPAILRRVGNCMIEFAPNNVLVEDWRLQNQTTGPLIGLQLLGEYDATGTLIRTGGGLIINDHYAAMVIGRTPHQTDQIATMVKTYKREHHEQATLPRLVHHYGHDRRLWKALMGCETNLAIGNINDGFMITRSTHPDRIQTSLLSLDGFSWDENGHLVQTLEYENQPYTRVYAVDVLDASFDYQYPTLTTPAAQSWMQQESAWRTRYTQTIL